MTPLGMRRAILYRFPEFKDVKVIREGWGKTKAYCQYREVPIDEQVLRDWVAQHRVAGTAFECVQVIDLPAHPDELGLLRKTRLPQDVVEDAKVNGDGLDELLSLRWPGVFLRTFGDACMEIVVARGTSDEVKEEIRAAALVLLAAEVQELKVIGEETFPRGTLFRTSVAQRLSPSAQRQFEYDREMLQEHLQDVLEGDCLPQELPSLPTGSSTYAVFSDGIESLIHRLSLYEKVYVDVPYNKLGFDSWVGSSLDEFLAALPNGRLIPVFGHLAPRYAPGIVDRILDAGAARVVLPGEARLRTLVAMVKENPLLAALSRMDDDVRSLHALLRAKTTDPRLHLLRVYLDRLAEGATTLRMVARGPYDFSMTYSGLAHFLDDLVRSGGKVRGDRTIDFAEALNLHYVCDALSASPMCLAGHRLEPYLRLVRAAGPGDPVPVTFDEPEAIGEVLLGTTGMSVAEFSEVFRGAAVDRMQSLMQSPRWWEGQPPSEVIAEFNREVRQVNGTAAGTSASILATAGTTFLTGATAFVVSLALTVARPALETIAPSFCDRLDSFVTGVSREGVLLAKIRRNLT